eukprot:gene18399-5890_t
MADSLPLFEPGSLSEFLNNHVGANCDWPVIQNIVTVDTCGSGASGEAILGFWHHKGDEISLVSGTIFQEVQGSRSRIDALDMVIKGLRHATGAEAPTVLILETNYGGVWEIYREHSAHIDNLQFVNIHVNVGMKWHALRLMKGLIAFGHIWTHSRIKDDFLKQIESELYSVKHCGSPHIKAPKTTGKDTVSCIVLAVFYISQCRHTSCNKSVVHPPLDLSPSQL